MKNKHLKYVPIWNKKSFGSPGDGPLPKDSISSGVGSFSKNFLTLQYGGSFKSWFTFT